MSHDADWLGRSAGFYDRLTLFVAGFFFFATVFFLVTFFMAFFAGFFFVATFFAGFLIIFLTFMFLFFLSFPRRRESRVKKLLKELSWIPLRGNDRKLKEYNKKDFYLLYP